MPTVRELWDKQNFHPGDRERLFGAVGDAIDADSALYPGSYVDIAPSLVFGDVTYVDMDRRAAGFFADADDVAELLTELGASPNVQFRFFHGDYREPLEIPDQSVDLLISLYAGFVSDTCTRYLRIGGTLLVNPSHGDAALAALDERYRLAGVVLHKSSQYRVATDDLDQYMIPKRDAPVTRTSVLESGRGVAYTKPAFAYLFTRIA